MSSGGGGAVIESLVHQLERHASEREAEAHRSFTEFYTREKLALVSGPENAGSGPSVQWHVESGQELGWLGAFGMNADLIVASRGTPGDNTASRSTLHSLLLKTGRPVLVPGGSAVQPDLAERVAIAWKPTPQAARAVVAAMPLISRAGEVVVMSVDEEEGTHGSTDRLVGYFAWHEIKKVVVQRLSPGPQSAAETLLAAASKTAGLLVMGGYGHTRLTEWAFGGFTRRVLADAPLPVLLAH